MRFYYISQDVCLKIALN